MTCIVPETATRLQATIFAKDAELSALGRDSIIRLHAERMAEAALRKLIADCIKTVDDYCGYKGQTLMLDCYVLSPHELHQIIAKAIEQGRSDAMRWA